MKSVLLATVLSIVSASSAFAADVPCAREGTLAAFRAVLDDKEANLSSMTGVAISDAGASLKKKSGNKVILTVSLVLTENDMQRPEIVDVELNTSYDNACQVISAKIQSGY